MIFPCSEINSGAFLAKIHLAVLEASMSNTPFSQKIDIDVVNGEGARGTEILQGWDLNVNDVLGSHFSSTSPKGRTNQ